MVSRSLNITRFLHLENTSKYLNATIYKVFIRVGESGARCLELISQKAWCLPMAYEFSCRIHRLYNCFEIGVCFLSWIKSLHKINQSARGNNVLHIKIGPKEPSNFWKVKVLLLATSMNRVKIGVDHDYRITKFEKSSRRLYTIWIFRYSYLKLLKSKQCFNLFALHFLSLLKLSSQ